MSPARYLVALVLLAGLTVGVAPSLAAPEPWNAKVLWARADRAYVALAESTAVTPGTILTFEEAGATIAKGEVSAAYEGQLVAVTLTSGSLDKARSLASVRITAEPPSLRPMPLLRIGYPAPGRPNLLFTCERVVPRAPRSGDLYRVDALSDRSFRFVRTPDVAVDAPWPDTILVRLFDVIADEEIALERGDLDVAVFWPGEPSPHIRAHTSWKDEPSGSLANGTLVVQPASGSAGTQTVPRPVTRALRSMNEDLFRGDLAACRSTSSTAPGDSTAGATRAKFEVHRAIPGWQPLERFLNQGVPAKLDSSWITVRLQRVHGHMVDTQGAVEIPAPGTAPPQGACVFAIRCPILSAPRLKPYLNALGPDALIRLFSCFPLSAEP
jgi:hypothetical protein